MQNNTITIKGTAYEVRFSLRAIKHFEELASKSISESAGTWDHTLFFFCTLKALNKGFEMTFDAFVDYLDNNTDVLIQWQALNVEAENTEGNDLTKQATKTLKKNNLSSLWMLSLLCVVCMGVAPLIFGIGLIPMSLWGIIKLISSIGKKQKP